MQKRLTWQQIKELYPHQYVGLVNVKTSINEVSIESAEVKYTSNDTSYEDLLWMCIKGEIELFYTTLDDDALGGVML